MLFRRPHRLFQSPRGPGLLLLLALLPLGARGPGTANPPSGQDPIPPPPVDSLPRPMDLAIPRGLEIAFAQLDPPVTTGLPLDPGLVALGRLLFFDPVLSQDRRVACASCHQPDHSLADPRAFSIGVQGPTSRNAPTLINRILGKRHMWDGRVQTLEEQVLMPLANAQEMNLPAPQAARRLAGLAPWKEHFQEIFGEGPSPNTIARALAAFVRALVQGDSPVDQFLAGDVTALNPEEEAGMWVFDSRGKCWRCHRGANYSDEELHATGIGTKDGQAAPGAFAITQDPSNRGQFKTPTLRGLAHSGPYMHNGSLATLEEVVAFYRKGGNRSDSLSPLIEPLDLTDNDASNLVAFLMALTPR